ncbi:uncharacterized protein LOC127724685 [Mytilus californianus]|uniref:uncharacterized protein LOC127724685 n=1 Tax=Mytilus californianus TaxID=6549 RepID=UPI002247B06E|nr:uncharacterized protein LOC127724685 [Mytilus californianus]XP_052087695.1 uncharacterized protein LOC127724685 [Mytilus californianus]XP_052087697.1 uncharacterized protein LOC127724685 [Mytilus californianus]XP_052087698.1 uncharacterized protein LOC127724685 [Mytilus californianus]XP_052087699.1 uncharacterized protein LOC127724685 [Mytilus californianus]
MAAYKFTSHRQLRGLLNDAEVKQKKDIAEFAGGHLNESLLYKPSSEWASAKWTAGKDTASSSPKSAVSRETNHNEGKKMKNVLNVLYDFSVGTSGSLPIPSKKSTPNKKDYKKEYDDSRPVSTRKDISPVSRKSIYSELNDGVLVEELKAEEMMLPPPLVAPQMKKSPPPADYDVMEELTERLDNDGYLTFRHTFLPTHHTGVTKKDQFHKMKQFESGVLRKQDSSEQNVLTGVKAVEHLEKKLKQELDNLNIFDSGPNFHKLQVYSNIYEDLLLESATFAYILRCIKTEYDNYISRLLDKQTPQNSRMLRDQVQQMTSRGTSRPKDLIDAKQKVVTLEEKATSCLEENERLRKKLDEEKIWLENASEPEPRPAISSVYKEEPPPELCDEIEHVKSQILEKLDDLQDLRTKLRADYVPLTVCSHLEQCIKETEIEVQKLLKQNEYLEKTIGDMESELKDAIQDADTSERDSRRIWRKVNSRRGLPGSTGEEDDDDDDESKWNWYIS